MMRRALVLGSRGFLGRHLVGHLKDRGIEVTGGIRPGTGSRHGTDLQAADVVVECDMMDQAGLARTLRVVAPTEVYHLAGWSKGADVTGGMALNTIGTYHLLEAVVESRLPVKVLIPGSAAEYGAVEIERFPIGEGCPLNPVSLYGISKVTQGILAGRYSRVYGLPIYWVRPFNVIGPGEPPSTVCSHLAQQVAAVQAGLQRPRVEVRALDTSRDFVDVRDVVRAMDLVMERGEAGEAYNICSGSETQIRAVVGLLHELSGGGWEIWTSPGPHPPDEVSRQQGSYEKLHRATGWVPTINLKESLRTLLDTWRETLATARPDRVPGS